MTEDDKAVPDTEASSKSGTFRGKDRRERSRPYTKIVCRRLPPNMTEESFLEQVSPIPEYDYFYFSKPDFSLTPNVFSRAYINFVNVDDIFVFRDKFDDYIFLDEKGNEFPAIVEYAPFQRLPKKRRKKDQKCGTIDTDSTYLEFLESLKETDSDSREPKMEYSYQPTEEKKETTTPLLEFLSARRREERKRREERQRRRPRNRTSKDDEFFDDEVKKIKPRDNEKEKISHKKGEEDIITSKSEIAQSDSKDTKFQGKSSGSSKSFREQRKKPDFDKKEFSKGKDSGDSIINDSEKISRNSKRDRQRENVRDKTTKDVKKYSDSRKDKIKPNDKRSDQFSSYRQIDENEIDSTLPSLKESKSVTIQKAHVTSAVTNDSTTEKSFSGLKGSLMSSKIRPFTQLPQYKAEDLPKVIEELDKNTKKNKMEKYKAVVDESADNADQQTNKTIKSSEDGVRECHDKEKSATTSTNERNSVKDKTLSKSKESLSPVKSAKKNNENDVEGVNSGDSLEEVQRQRRSSLESSEAKMGSDDPPLRRHKSLDDKAQEADEENVEHPLHRHKNDPRTERRIRNKDRPSIVIYQPGMGRFSKQRLEREKDVPAGSVKSSPEIGASSTPEDDTIEFA